MHNTYIIIYNENDHIFCSSLLQQLIGSISSGTIYNIFNSNIYTQSEIAFYEKFLRNDKGIKTIFRTYNLSDSISDIVKDDIAKTKKFIIIPPYTILDTKSSIDFFNHTQAKRISINSNTNIGILNTMDMIDLIRDQKNINDLMAYINIKDSVVSTDIFTTQIPIKKNTTKFYFEDDACLFAFFDFKHSNIEPSYCYFNKKNYKIFNISQSILGLVTIYNDQEISIEWIINKNHNTIKYQKINGSFM